jgi:hypothetical protein
MASRQVSQRLQTGRRSNPSCGQCTRRLQLYSTSALSLVAGDGQVEAGVVCEEHDAARLVVEAADGADAAGKARGRCRNGPDVTFVHVARVSISADRKETEKLQPFSNMVCVIIFMIAMKIMLIRQNTVA